MRSLAALVTRAHRGILTFAAVLGAIPVVAGAVIYVGSWMDRHWYWRDAEYTKLRSLRAGFTLAAFDRALGPPVFSTPRSGYRNSLYRGRDYWVQALSHRNVVEVYSVTSCDDSFRPTFHTPLGTSVTLSRDHLADVAPGDGENTVDAEYFVSGTTGYDYFYEGGQGSNPTLCTCTASARRSW